MDGITNKERLRTENERKKILKKNIFEGKQMKEVLRGRKRRGRGRKNSSVFKSKTLQKLKYFRKNLSH